MVGTLQDREGWARDVAAAVTAADRAPTEDAVCAVLAVIGQESNFQVDPVVANLPQIVRGGLLTKLHALGPLAEPAMNALLSGHAPGSTASFKSRIDSLRTEGDLDRRELLGARHDACNERRATRGCR